MSKYEIIGIGKKYSGDETGAHEAFLMAKDYAEKNLAETPNEANRHTKLASMLAWLGEKEKAIAEAKKAGEMVPEKVDAFDGPNMVQNLAEVYAITGEQDKAIDLLDGLLSRPGPLTVQLIKLLPIWDPLRNNPDLLRC